MSRVKKKIKMKREWLKTVHVDITMPQNLLDQTNELAEKLETSRSRLMQEAIKFLMNSVEFEEGDTVESIKEVAEEDEEEEED